MICRHLADLAKNNCHSNVCSASPGAFDTVFRTLGAGGKRNIVGTRVRVCVLVQWRTRYSGASNTFISLSRYVLLGLYFATHSACTHSAAMKTSQNDAVPTGRGKFTSLPLYKLPVDINDSRGVHLASGYLVKLHDDDEIHQPAV